jgi:methylated-DNA-protein-cysteine methyltransferase related protein
VEYEARVVEHVREIPVGSVATYGEIDPRAPRRVGYVLAITREEIPWHRVVRSDGTVAMGPPQLERLRREGVPLKGQRVDLRRVRTQRSTVPGRKAKGSRLEDRVATSVREELDRALRAIPGVARRVSRWGTEPAYFVGDREIAHFHKDGRMDVRLTRAVIRERKSLGSLDRRIRTRGPSSEWVAVDAAHHGDAALVLALVEEAVRANA